MYELEIGRIYEGSDKEKVQITNIYAGSVQFIILTGNMRGSLCTYTIQQFWVHYNPVTVKKRNWSLLLFFITIGALISVISIFLLLLKLILKTVRLTINFLFLRFTQLYLIKQVIFGKNIRDKYYATRHKEFLDKAISSWLSVKRNPAFYFSSLKIKKFTLNELTTSFLERYTLTGSHFDLNYAIRLSKHLIANLPDEDEDLGSILTNYGVALSERYEKKGSLKDLELSIDVFYNVKEKTPISHKDYAGRLTNLGNALRNRYIRLGVLHDLESCINYSAQSIDATLDTGREFPGRLNNLAIGFYDRFVHLGMLSDLDESISLKTNAFSLATQVTEKIQYGHNLSVDLLSCFKIKTPSKTLEKNSKRDSIRLKKILDSAIFYQENALSLSLDTSPYRAGCLQTMGECYHAKYSTSEDKDINCLITAADHFRNALKLTHLSSPQYKMFSNSFANVLVDYAAHTEKVEYIDEAINLLKQSNYIESLAEALRIKYQLTKSDETLFEAISTYRKSAKKYSELNVNTKLKHYTNWLSWAFSRKCYSEVEEVSNHIHQSIDNIIKIQSFRSYKESWLKDMQGIATKTAYAFAKLDKPKEAAEALEQGQARLLSESLALIRTNLTALQNTEHAHLYDAYQETTQRWHWAQQHKPEELKNIREQLDGIIEQIRQLPGYAEFLKPSGWADIELAAAETPLLYVLTTEHGGLALLVQRDAEVQPLWLPNFTETALQEMLQNYLAAYNAWLSAEEENHDAPFGAWCNALDKTTRRLWDCVFAPLQNKLPEELVLIPAGLLNLLPLHAAWTADDRGGRRYALDNWRIRYAPNARAIKKSSLKKIATGKLLAIDDPDNSTNPHITPLTNSVHEVRATCAGFAEVNMLSGATATRTAVLKALSNSQVLHFSCHGHSNLDEPLHSSLLMANGEQLTLQDFIDTRLQARLAVLSACETGVPGTKLPDEVVSLAAGLLQAGAAGVISSLWSVSDLSTMLLMSRFYQLWRNDYPDNPPEALRQAQQWIRDSTVADFKAHFKTQMRQAGETGQVAKEIYKNFALQDPGQRPFEHPFYWAAFAYVGV